MKVLVHYETGFPTALQKHNKLAALILRDGPPDRIEGARLIWSRGIGRFACAWDYFLSGFPFFPGDTRKIVRVELCSI